MAEPTDRTVVFTDGACKGNPGPGGWAWAIPDGSWAAGFDSDTTNQRMEITAAYQAVLSNPGPVHIVSDSTYVVNCFNDGWWKGWKQRNWRNSRREPVANRDLWEPFVELAVDRDVTFEWVKGHSGHPMNDLVDRLAVAATERRGAASGDYPPEPDQLGGPDTLEAPANVPRSVESTPAVRDRRIPSDTPWSVAGVRDTRLAASWVGASLRRKMSELFEAHRELYPDLVVLTGLRPGAEQIAAGACVDVGVPYVAVMPYPDPAAKWTAATRSEFESMCDAATSVVTLEKKRPLDREAQIASLARRDGWLRSVSMGAFVVTDDADRESVEVWKKFTRALGDEVWQIRVEELR